MKAIELTREAVTMWSTVAVRDLETNEVDIYTLVPPNEADITLNRISSLTPVAHALYGRCVGDTVDVAAPAGVIQLEICSIRQARAHRVWIAQSVEQKVFFERIDWSNARYANNNRRSS